MKKYLSYFKLRFNTTLEYREAALAGIVTQFFWGIMEIMIFMAFYKSGVETDISLQDLVTLIWLRQAFYGIASWSKDPEISRMIEKGNIAYELCRPVSIYWIWYFKTISSRLAATLLKFSPILILASFLPSGYKLMPPESLLSFVLFLITLSLSVFVVAGILNLLYISFFYTISSKGSAALFYAVASFFAGNQIPIALMPKALQIFCYILPFGVIIDLPNRIWSGNINTQGALIGIGIQLMWIFILIIVGNLLMNKSLKKVVVQGG